MSRADRIIGLVRSLLVYHAIPRRQRRMQRLYRQFAKPGDLVFDIGAHVGNRARALAALGCRVIALEPQPDFARMLRLLFGRNSRIEVVEAAVTGATGEEWLDVSERTPTVSTTATAWREARAREPGFGGVEWSRRVRVRTVTADALIARYGRPAFIKIDVEGGEPAVLDGLTMPVPALSFEYLPGAIDEVRACVDRLWVLSGESRYEFNWSVGESYELASPEWLDGDGIVAALTALGTSAQSGDVYARLRAT
ncbi:MAG TPA: FkbM family methyltransferase [Vicinamibacterales bacterium]|nr:FkbM family methyltransferase [Vicinamibacterales bacterium]